MIPPEILTRKYRHIEIHPTKGPQFFAFFKNSNTIFLTKQEIDEQNKSFEELELFDKVKKAWYDWKVQELAEKILDGLKE